MSNNLFYDRDQGHRCTKQSLQNPVDPWFRKKDFELLDIQSRTGKEGFVCQSDSLTSGARLFRKRT